MDRKAGTDLRLIGSATDGVHAHMLRPVVVTPHAVHAVPLDRANRQPNQQANGTNQRPPHSKTCHISPAGGSASGLYSGRRLPRLAHSLKVDSWTLVDLGRMVSGGTLPRLSCDRSVL